MEQLKTIEEAMAELEARQNAGGEETYDIEMFSNPKPAKPKISMSGFIVRQLVMCVVLAGAGVALYYFAPEVYEAVSDYINVKLTVW